MDGRKQGRKAVSCGDRRKCFVDQRSSKCRGPQAGAWGRGWFGRGEELEEKEESLRGERMGGFSVQWEPWLVVSRRATRCD